MELRADKRPRIGFVGAGRVGTALSRALARAGEPVVAAFSRTPGKAQAIASAVPGCHAVSTLQETADASDLLFLTVSDDAIAAVAAAVRWRPGLAAVHCSGAAELDVLEAANAQGSAVGSFHPLQLFADPEVAVRGLARCAIAIDAGVPLVNELERLARSLGSRILRVPRGKRAAYHAASHYGAAFVCVLLEEGTGILQTLGIDEAQARAALLALTRGTLEAAERDGPARAMAGVYARGDIGTAARHVEALACIGQEQSRFYAILAERSIRLALEAGRLDAGMAGAMRRLLK